MIRWVSWVLVGVSLLLIPKASAPALADSPIDEASCTYKGKNLYGTVQIVQNFPDIKVKIVSDFPDLKVKQVTAFATKCGEWQIVESLGDLKVQIVDAFPDIQIQYVDAFPGIH
jgi:hypothetical protein